MLIRRAERFKASDVTDETLYLNRREFIAGGAAAVALGAYDVADAAAPPAGAPLQAERNEALSVKDAATKLESATTYNNFYEFGVNKDDPAREAHRLKTRSEEHTSELQSLTNLVCRLLLEKKKE